MRYTLEYDLDFDTDHNEGQKNILTLSKDGNYPVKINIIAKNSLRVVVSSDITVDGPSLTKDHQYHCIATVDPRAKLVTNECTDLSNNT